MTKKKTCTYKIYDFNEGGFGIPDQRVYSFTWKQKPRKWTLFALAYVLDMSRFHNQAIYAMNTRDTSTKSFLIGWDLMISLIKPHMN